MNPDIIMRVLISFTIIREVDLVYIDSCIEKMHPDDKLTQKYLYIVSPIMLI